MVNDLSAEGEGALHFEFVVTIAMRDVDFEELVVIWEGAQKGLEVFKSLSTVGLEIIFEGISDVFEVELDIHGNE